MRSAIHTILIVFAMAGSVTCDLAAQPSDQCIITYTGQNRNRSVSSGGLIGTECGGGWHDGPWGNWGVTSNYGHVQDGNQFPGHHPGIAFGTGRRIWEWNSCTTLHPVQGGQRSTRGIATHGSRTHRIPLSCGGSPIFPLPSPQGCNAGPRSWGASNNFMSLYELDWDGNDFITTLYFPSTSVSLNCNYYGCTGGTSGWVGVSRSTNPRTGVDADMRSKASARYQSGCMW